MHTTEVLKSIPNYSTLTIGLTGVVLITGTSVKGGKKKEMNEKAKKEKSSVWHTVKLFIEQRLDSDMRSFAQLRATERTLNARIDALELYVDDVTEKYLKKAESKPRYAREKEPELLVAPMDGFETIRQKYGGRE